MINRWAAMMDGLGKCGVMKLFFEWTVLINTDICWKITDNFRVNVQILKNKITWWSPIIFEGEKPHQNFFCVEYKYLSEDLRSPFFLTTFCRIGGSSKTCTVASGGCGRGSNRLRAGGGGVKKLRKWQIDYIFPCFDFIKRQIWKIEEGAVAHFHDPPTTLGSIRTTWLLVDVTVCLIFQILDGG